MKQGELIFIHDRENNPESEAFLNANRTHFTTQCKHVYDLLRSGVRLTTMNAPGYGILSLPRRILDLKRNNGIEIKETWIRVGEVKIKEWWL